MRRSPQSAGHHSFDTDWSAGCKVGAVNGNNLGIRPRNRNLRRIAHYGSASSPGDQNTVAGVSDGPVSTKTWVPVADTLDLSRPSATAELLPNERAAEVTLPTTVD